ncbi:ribose-5-phosphate isomerase [Nocardiopsis salina]|uniref:ribose-5-phosphate isomerase n=1 Tax=Nocardiopsis salina TaxID=245836 RepID=UPI00034DBCE0|nr:ribose-5-phosphate isomerase [Nocardiopsis salina]
MTRTWRLVVGSDDAGLEYKDLIATDLQGDPRVTDVVDVGVNGDEHTPYPDIGAAAARIVAEGRADRAVLVCGTGIGMAISANKVSGVRATTAHDSYSTERSVLSNDCQVLTLGQRVIGPELARRLVREWLDYEFDPESPSHAKVARINALESGCGEAGGAR